MSLEKLLRKETDPDNENEKVERLFDVYESSFKLYSIAKYMNSDVLANKEELVRDYSSMLGTLFPEEKEQLHKRLASINPVPPAKSGVPFSKEEDAESQKEEEKGSQDIKIQVESDQEEIAKKAASFGCLLPMWSIFLDKVAINSAFNVLVFEIIPFIEQDLTLLSYFFKITEPHLADLSENDVIIVFDSLVSPNHQPLSHSFLTLMMNGRSRRLKMSTKNSRFRCALRL